VTKNYDVAISFITADEPLALTLQGLLQPPLNVFVYSKRQDELGGKDGIEAFRDVFRNRTQLVVTLFRTPWGQTPWTRVEQTAIEELCLAAGWEHFLFVRLDNTPVPTWVPKPHLYLDLSRFTMSDLAGAIKARLLELGVEIKPPTAAARAAAIARSAEFDKETDRLLGDPGVFNSACEELKDALTEIAGDVAAETGWQVVTGTPYYIGGFMVATRGRTFQLSTQKMYVNSAREAYAEVAEYPLNWPLAEPGKQYGITQQTFDQRRHVARLNLRRLPDLGWCWEIDQRVLPIQAAAEAIMNKLLDGIVSKT